MRPFPRPRQGSPRQEDREPTTATVDGVEERVAHAADLVLKLTSLAERYQRSAASSPEARSRLQELRDAAASGRRYLQDLADA